MQAVAAMEWEVASAGLSLTILRNPLNSTASHQQGLVRQQGQPSLLRSGPQGNSECVIQGVAGQRAEGEWAAGQGAQVAGNQEAVEETDGLSPPPSPSGLSRSKVRPEPRPSRSGTSWPQVRAAETRVHEGLQLLRLGVYVCG